MKKAKKIFEIILAVLLALAAIVIVYVLYVMITYKRLPDQLGLVVDRGQTTGETVATGQEYNIVSYNIGFGAYTPDFSFFMDGGTSSWANSKESVLSVVESAALLVRDDLDADFVLWQEVDLDSTRSYHVNQYEMLRNLLPTMDSVFAVNYDSAFLCLPIYQPHGKSKAGLATMTSFAAENGLRRSLPISDTMSKFMDLDRCYSITKIPVENGRYLCLINIHMSAYGSSDTVREGQITMLCEDMKREYEAGNYIICGGDFNHDLKALEDDGEERASWAYPFPRDYLPEGFSFALDLLGESEVEALHNSARDADAPYDPDTTYTVTLDGFIISDNVECIEYENIDLQYLYSDHDPVFMKFVLK